MVLGTAEQVEGDGALTQELTERAEQQLCALFKGSGFCVNAGGFLQHDGPLDGAGCGRRRKRAGEIPGPLVCPSKVCLWLCLWP